jgi:hypothetical protein
MHYINISFCNNVLKQRHPTLCCEFYILTHSVILSIFVIVIEKYKGKLLYMWIVYFNIFFHFKYVCHYGKNRGKFLYIFIYIRMHDWFCMLKFMLPACRPFLPKLPARLWRLSRPDPSKEQQKSFSAVNIVPLRGNLSITLYSVAQNRRGLWWCDVSVVVCLRYAPVQLILFVVRLTWCINKETTNLQSLLMFIYFIWEYEFWNEDGFWL